MKTCTVCEQKVQQGYYNGRLDFVCLSCRGKDNPLHTNTFTIEENRVVEKSPFDGLSESDQRSKFINFAYVLLNNKLSPAAYRLMNKYIKDGYSWLGMLQAMEYFYVVKKNPTSKARNNIGIIPYVYQDAAKWYEGRNRVLRNKFQEDLAAFQKVEQQKKEAQVVNKEVKKRKNLIDLSDI